MTIGTVETRLFVVSHLAASVSVNGASSPISIGVPGQNAVISFVGTAGQALLGHVTNNLINSTYVYLRKPDGTTMTYTASGSANFDLSSQTLPSAGTYSVLVDPIGSATGGIAISVTSP